MLKINIILDATLVPSYSFLNYFCYPCHSYWSLQKKIFKDLKLEYIPDKKETHHIELFNSQEDHKGLASLVYISAKVMSGTAVLHVFCNQASKCVEENCS